MSNENSWTNEEWREARKGWRKSKDPSYLLRGILGGLEFELNFRFSPRRLRLFMVACLRRFSHILRDERSRRWIDILELLAEGQITSEKVEQLLREEANSTNEDLRCSREDENSPIASAWSAIMEGFQNDLRPYNAEYVASAAVYALYERPHPFDPLENHRRLGICHRREAKFQVPLIHDIFGNPFRPVVFDPAWRTPNVSAIAQTIYDERRFAELPVLADALEEAGCTSEDILSHLRSGGEHVLGCWALDLVLGKS